MKIKIYQIAPEKDEHFLLFMNYKYTMDQTGINEDIYELVFEGEVETSNLEEIYTLFNVTPPEGYLGRSMSVSDVVCLDGFGTFFCDSCGFKQILFDGEKCKWRKFNG